MANLTLSALQQAVAGQPSRHLALWAEKSAGWVPISSDELMVLKFVPMTVAAFPWSSELTQHLALYRPAPIAPDNSGLTSTQYATYSVEDPAALPRAHFVQRLKPQALKAGELYDLAQRLNAQVALLSTDVLPESLKKQLPLFSETSQASETVSDPGTVAPPRTGTEGQVSFIERHQKTIVGVIAGGLSFALAAGMVRRLL